MNKRYHIPCKGVMPLKDVRRRCFLDGSCLSLIVPISRDASNQYVSKLIQTYQSITNVELIFVAHKSLNVDPFRLVVNDAWQHVYEAHVIGAKKATRPCMLFLDLNQHITVPTLQQFLQPLMDNTADAVLNNMDYEFQKKHRHIPSTIFPQITNAFIHRSDLKIDQIMFVPYGLSRKAVDTIGIDTLSNPVEAHVKLVQQGYVLSHQLPIRNIFQLQNQVWDRKDDRRRIDDYLQAYTQRFPPNSRSKFSDGERRLDVLDSVIQGHQPTIRKNDHANNPLSQLSVIIPAQNEQARIKAVIEECMRLGPLEIIVVVNGSNDQTAVHAYDAGATVIQFAEKLGLDTGRAIGAHFATGEILLFVDGDFVIAMEDLKPFVQAVERGVDVAVNDLNASIKQHWPLHLVTACKYAINVACNRADLGVGSIVAVPHALRRKSIEKVGVGSLANPVLAYVKLIVNHCVVENVHHVEVDKINRFRPHTHYANRKGCLAPTTSVIVGDHLEAMIYLGNLQKKGEKKNGL